jgi:GalNAc-alpha-(1->4)-GalNAc-alpha-(1->3)-diNAcBac-PP-undecaprenol alpha-1,4-N-acetyl-D-galactosaminyltransferase
MRLLFVIDSFGSGGAQRQMVQIALGLVAAGHSVEFFVYAPRHEHFRPVIDAAGIAVHVHEKRSRYSLGVIAALARVLRAGGFDIVLAYLTTPGLYAEVAALVNRARGTRTPVVVSERGPLPHVSLKLRLALGAHRLADHVVMNSRNNRDQLLSLWPWLRERSSVIYNGIDLALFFPPPAPRAAMPRSLKVLAIGTLLPTKDALALVEAMAIHREHHGWVPEVAWVGKLSGTGGDQAYERRVRSRLAALDLDGHWSWLGERRDVPDLLRSHDVLVHPSILEGLPNAVCEALASGLPVVAARIGDNEALVAHGQTGFLYPPGDAEALSAAMAQYASLGERGRTDMRAAARAFAVGTLGLDRCVSNYEALFQRVLERAGA